MEQPHLTTFLISIPGLGCIESQPPQGAGSLGLWTPYLKEATDKCLVHNLYSLALQQPVQFSTLLALLCSSFIPPTQTLSTKRQAPVAFYEVHSAFPTKNSKSFKINSNTTSFVKHFPHSLCTHNIHASILLQVLLWNLLHSTTIMTSQSSQLLGRTKQEQPHICTLDTQMHSLSKGLRIKVTYIPLAT